MQTTSKQLCAGIKSKAKTLKVTKDGRLEKKLKVIEEKHFFFFFYDKLLEQKDLTGLISSYYFHKEGCFNLYPFAGQSVGLSPELYKNYIADLHKTWMESGPQPRIELLSFWSRSSKMDGSRTIAGLPLELSSRAVFNISVPFSGNNTYNT